MYYLFKFNLVLSGRGTNMVLKGLVSERGSFLLVRILLLNNWLWVYLYLSCFSARGFF
jgi:hypothetical protein